MWWLSFYAVSQPWKDEKTLKEESWFKLGNEPKENIVDAEVHHHSLSQL